jgi:PKHD-type hydroxylase
MYYVNKHLQQLNYFCVVNDVFSKEEIEKIMDLEDIQSFKKGLVGGGDIHSQYNSKTRESDIMWIHPFDLSEWLFDKFGQLVSAVNHDHFLYDISGFDAFQYTVYREDSHYDWHIDVGNISTNFERKISATIMLSDPNSYEGGELNFILGGQVNTPHVIKPNMGDVVFFSSWTPHKVAPVKSGVRKSLVTWVVGER